MSQQLHLFPGVSASKEQSSTIDPGSLLEQTKQIFHYNGSTSDLIERIVAATKAIDEHCNSNVR